MITAFLYLLLACCSLFSLLRPWLGVIIAYLYAILSPQIIWWWHFQGIRPVLWILLPTIMGTLIVFFNGRLSFKCFKTKMSSFMFLLWLFFSLSSFIGPYTSLQSPYRFYEVDWTLSITNNIFILYFIAIALIDSEYKLKHLASIIVISTIYFIYWINCQYFLYHVFGRIAGPSVPSGGGTYTDENIFAMMFVTGLPFLYYIGLYSKCRFIRYALWLVVPLGWHAVFLTGSRGGFLGLAVTMIVVAFRSTRKIIAICMILAFALAYYWQAGDLMKGRASTISSYTDDRSAETRFEAWEAAIKMIIEHPLSGVGLASFGPAFPVFSDKEPRVAHNTFLQIAAESGLPAGLSFLAVVFLSFIALCRTARRLKPLCNCQTSFSYIITESTLAGLVGLITCSTFLSLQVYEIFYFLCALASIIERIYSFPQSDNEAIHPRSVTIESALIH